MVFIFLVTLSFLTPFYLQESNLKHITEGAQLLAALSSLFTLYLAILLFNKFGIEKSIIQKKVDVTLNILEKLNKKNFLMKVADKQHVLLNFFVTTGVHDVKSYWFDYKDFNLLFGKSYIEELYEIQRLVEDLYAPKEITKGFESLKFSFSRIPQNEIHDYIIVTAPGLKNNEEYPAIINDKFISLEKFATDWEDFIKAIKTWLDKNSNLSPDLNIFSRACLKTPS
jgi:hypothetical protein